MFSVQLSTHHMLFREENGWLCLSSPSAKCVFTRIVTSFGSAAPPPNCCFLLLRYECTNSNSSGQHTHARKPSNLASENGINSQSESHDVGNIRYVVYSLLTSCRYPHRIVGATHPGTLTRLQDIHTAEVSCMHSA